ncbi:MAG: tetratricopeptide repeat protein [Pseudomonadota bacterium]
MEYQSVEAFFQANWGWAAGIAASMFGLTLFAGRLLHPTSRDEIALWLMGAQTEEGWSRSFISLFDAVFGERHLSWKCFVRSAIASLIAVAVIWLLMGRLGAIGPRLQAELSLGAVLALALIVNVAADYLSLLETRWLLGQMHRFRSWPVQALVLIGDLLLSGAIIWLAIYAYVSSPLYTGEGESFAEILGVFSIFSVLFYSTFLTSVWTWAYILSTWVMRTVARLRIARLLDVEGKPVAILGLILGSVVFLGSFGASLALQRDADGLTAADRTLCSVFKGPVCLHVAELTAEEQAQFDLILLACEGSMTRECVDQGLDRGFGDWEIRPTIAGRLFGVACESGNARGCTALGHLHVGGIGLQPNASEAARLYARGCDGGDARGCTSLGYLHAEGIGMNPDPAEAARFFARGCDGDDARGCTNLGVLHEEGIGMDPDPAEAARLYARGCAGGNALGCINLGLLHERGIGADPDLAEAGRLYRLGCEMGEADACDWAAEVEAELQGGATGR